MAETYAVLGRPDKARDRALRWDGLVDEITLGATWSSPDHTRTMESFEAIAETFAPR